MTGATASAAGVTALEAVDNAGARAPVAEVCVPGLEPSALVTGVRTLAALAAWGVDAADAAELLELGPVPELATAVASCAAGVAVEVTAEAAEVTVLVTGSEAGGGVVVTALVGVVAGGGLLGASAALVAAAVPCVADVAVEELTPDVAGAAVEVAAELTADVADVAVEVAADVADVTVEVAADVTEAVVDVTAEVSVLVTGAAAEPEVVAVEGAVDACACRENASKTSRIPAASIAHCAARRAARRKASCGIGTPPQRETGPDTTAHL